ncbi:MAG: hypothetical protein V4686_03885 [Patescibacteria group bacterium]
MTPQWTEVTWYSKLGTIVFLLLIVPVLSFYIGKSYQEVVTLPVAGAGSSGQFGYWTKVNISEDEAQQLFTNTHKYIQAKTEGYVYYDLVLDRLQNNWAYIRVVPQVAQSTSTQVYVLKEGGKWMVKAIGTPSSEQCSIYPELGC